MNWALPLQSQQPCFIPRITVEWGASWGSDILLIFPSLALFFGHNSIKVSLLQRGNLALKPIFKGAEHLTSWLEGICVWITLITETNSDLCVFDMGAVWWAVSTEACLFLYHYIYFPVNDGWPVGLRGIPLLPLHLRRRKLIFDNGRHNNTACPRRYSNEAGLYQNTALLLFCFSVFEGKNNRITNTRRQSWSFNTQCWDKLCPGDNSIVAQVSNIIILKKSFITLKISVNHFQYILKCRCQWLLHVVPYNFW